MKPASLLLSAGLAAALLVSSGCGAAGSSKTQAAESAPQPQNPLAVTANAELLKQLELGEAFDAPIAPTLSVAGRVEVDERRMARVGAPVTGRIVELGVFEGQPVKKGQVVATLHSTDLSAAQLGFLKALAQEQLAQRAAARARQLLAAEVIGEAELQRRDSELAQCSAEVRTWRDQLRVLGLSREAIERVEKTRAVDSVTPLIAPIDGIVLERKATVGQVVQPADTLLVIADLSSLWLVADVPEQAAGSTRPGKAVSVEIAALDNRRINGRLSYVAATVDPESRTIRARLDVPNPDGLLKPAMLATMTLQDAPRRERVVPTAAVVREGNQEMVFVQTAPGAFLLREVSLGGEFGDKRVLTGGLRAGERIVTNGAFHLNNERKKSALHGE